MKTTLLAAHHTTLVLSGSNASAQMSVTRQTSQTTIKRISNFEHSVVVERHFYMRNGGMQPLANVFVEDGGTLLCPDQVMVQGVKMWVFGQLQGVVDLVVSSLDARNGWVGFASSGYTHLLGEDDEKQWQLNNVHVVDGGIMELWPDVAWHLQKLAISNGGDVRWRGAVTVVVDEVEMTTGSSISVVGTTTTSATYPVSVLKLLAGNFSLCSDCAREICVKCIFARAQ